MPSTLLYYSPTWFLGYDIVLELIFAIITLTVAAYAFKIYRLSEQRELKLFGLSFLLISFSYSFWALLNGFAISELTEATSILDLAHATIYSVIGVYFHILFYLGGMITLTYMSLKVKSTKVLVLIISLILLFMLNVEEKYLLLYLVSAVLLIFVTYGYIEDARAHQNKKTWPLILAFILLFLGRFDFIFSSRDYRFYVIGHFLELAAYLIILTGLILVIKHKPKKVIP